MQGTSGHNLDLLNRTEIPHRKGIFPQITVGDNSCDIQGFTNLHIQAAVDRVSYLGGGIVILSAGSFRMEDSLHLRDNVIIRGSGSATVLRKAAMKKSPLINYVGYGHTALPVADPDIFIPGEGVLVSSSSTSGFLDTVATLTHRSGNTWVMNRPAYMDYSNTAGGCVRTLFPLIEATNVRNVSVEDMLLDGNKAENEILNGCRGGAFYAYRSSHIEVRRVTALDFAGDGFSFQTCETVVMESCTAESCSGHGFHPGSGSINCVARKCAARNCSGSGLFYCLCVTRMLVEDCLFENNAGHGMLIWARDDDNTNRRLTIKGNGGCGICFTATPQGQESSRHIFEQCTLEKNASKDGPAEILMQGGGTGHCLIRNRIYRSPGVPGILVAPRMPPIQIESNEISPPGDDAVAFQKEGD